MNNVKAFFAWMAGAPELWEEFLQVMQEVSPSDTEKMYERLSAFAKKLGHEEAADEMLQFYQEALSDQVNFSPAVQGMISGESPHASL